ncbi:MAG: flotillin-like protein FloA [Candidatus Riflebacteria bacterium]|nr:flotillin-like protein FloA [Candidatus Riflebacteria bacterium]
MAEGFVILLVIGGFFGFLVLSYFIPMGLWISALASGVSVGLTDLIAMRLRGVVPHSIINPAVMGRKGGLDIDLASLESHYLAGGNVQRVVSALIAAQRANIPLNFKQATAIDLAGRDVLEAVKMCVKPKVISTPEVSAMAKNGIQVKAIARITVKADITKLIGGATEETILARVGEGIVTTIGSAESHKEILENPDLISRTIQGKGLDAKTAFEILSIDIADVDIGNNIGAKLQIDQAEADMKIASAKAAERKAMAEAKEQEMRALEQEMRAKLVEAEQSIPRGIAQALTDGNIGILDYFALKNIGADTEMRKSFAAMVDPVTPMKG